MEHSTLFIDESGKSSLVDSKYNQFILTGVILNDDDIKTVEGFFTYIRRKYKIDTNRPFHSYDIFEDIGSDELTPKEMATLVETLADFINIIPIQIKIISINKVEFRKVIGIKSNKDFSISRNAREIKEFPYRIMAAKLFKWFAEYLHKTGSIGQIIVDAKKGSDDQLIKTLNLCKEFSGPLKPVESKLIKDKCTAICFADKTFLSGGLEITDFISYTSFFHVRKSMSEMNFIKLSNVWKIIKNLLENNKITKISNNEIRNFFGIQKDGVHKYLNSD